MTDETKADLKAAGREDLIKIFEINQSGYAGVNPNGNIVDRREFPDAIPVPENSLFGIPEPLPVNKKEWILCAAIHCDDKAVHKEQPDNISSGFIVSGRRHSDCYAVIEALVGVNDYFKKIDIEVGRDHQGFITNLNRYVGRKEAYGIAKRANQLINPKLVDPDMEFLISENLY